MDKVTVVLVTTILSGYTLLIINIIKTRGSVGIVTLLHYDSVAVWQFDSMEVGQ